MDATFQLSFILFQAFGECFKLSVRLTACFTFYVLVCVLFFFKSVLA